MTPGQRTPSDRAGWQRHAAAELAAVLDAHRDLPLIAWTVVPAGATLTGRVTGLAPSKARQVFDLWRVALTLTEHSEVTSGGGTTYLRAGAHRNPGPDRGHRDRLRRRSRGVRRWNSTTSRRWSRRGRPWIRP